MIRIPAAVSLLLWFVCRISAGWDITTNATVSEEFDLPSLGDNFNTSPPEGPNSTTLIGGVITSPLVPADRFQKWSTNLPSSVKSRRGFFGRLYKRDPFGSRHAQPSTYNILKTCQYVFTVQNAADCTHTSTEIAVNHVSRSVLPSKDDLGELMKRLRRLEKAVYGAGTPPQDERLQRDGIGIVEINIQDRQIPYAENSTTESSKETPPDSLIEMAQSILNQLSTLEEGIARSEKEKKDLRTQNKHLLSTLRRSAAAKRNFLTLKTNLENSLRSLRDENSRLRSSNASASSENEILQYRVEKLVALQESSRKNIRSMEMERARIKTSAIQCERKVKVLMRTTGQLQDRLRNMTSTVQRYAEMSHEDESLQYGLEKEREKSEALAAENVKLKDELENATKQIEELKKSLMREREGTTFDLVPTTRKDEQDFSYCGRITAISRPETIRAPRSRSYLEKFGVWMMDPLEALGEGKVWSMTTVKDKAKELKQYRSLRDFVSNRPENHLLLPVYAESNGAVVYNGSFYYQRRNSRKLIKYDLSLRRIVRERAIHHAGFHATFAYQWGGLTDIDLAVDEFGLWVIYSTRQNNGNIVLSRLNPTTLRPMLTAKTTIPKRAVANAFMACGILYTVDSYNTANASLNYEYDTFRRRVKRISIPIANQHRFNVMIDYNPRTREIFSWDDSCQVKYYASLDKSLGEISQLAMRSGRRRRRRA